MKSNQDDAVEINALDRTISYFFANAGNMIKFGPLGIGFLLFLIYFCQNNFFPSFDLFSLASLLLAAFAIGLAAYLVLAFGIAAPGFFWFDAFANDRDVREELEYSNKWRSINKDAERLKYLGGVYFFLPLLLCNFFFLWAATSDFFDGDLRGTLSVMGPLVLFLLLGFGLKITYQLGVFSVVKYVITSFFSVMLAGVVNLVLIVMVVKAHFETADDAVQMLAAVGGTLILAILFFGSAIAGLKHFRYTVFFSALFSVLVSIVVGAWLVLPGKIVQILGIGNYVATEVVLNNGACEEFRVAFDGIVDDKCVINDVRIIWSLGEIYRLEISHDTSKAVMIVPSGSVSAISILQDKDA